MTESNDILPPEIENAAKAAMNELIPSQSKEMYNLVFTNSIKGGYRSCMVFIL